MSSGCKGRCLCGKVSYDTGSEPLWVTICYCRFCQRATGADRMIEPIFERGPFTFTGSSPSIYTLPSEGSGKDVNVHFCADCGTKLALTFERWPDRIGILVGTLDTPAAVVVTSENSKHIFVSEARAGTILPADFKTFQRHATENDGSAIEPIVHSSPFTVRGGPTS